MLSTKIAALRSVNKHKSSRSFTHRQVSDQLKDIGLDCGSETVRQWFQNEGTAKVARRLKPCLSEARKKRRIDFICDQVDETTGDFLQGNAIHLDESWGFSSDLPGEVYPRVSPRTTQGSTSRRSWSLWQNAWPDPSHDFDGKIGIWRICVLKTKRPSDPPKRRGGGEEYEFDCTIYGLLPSGTRRDTSTSFYLLAAIKKKMPWMPWMRSK